MHLTLHTIHCLLVLRGRITLVFIEKRQFFDNLVAVCKYWYRTLIAGWGHCHRAIGSSTLIIFWGFLTYFLCLHLKVPAVLRFRVVCLSVRLSVHLSVRPKPKIPSFHLYMGPLVHPTKNDRFSACPSVHLERFLGISWRPHGGNGLKFCMRMYPDHLQNWLDYGHGLLIFLLFAPLDRSYLGFPGIVWRMLGSKCWGGIFPTLCVELCLVSFVCSLQFPILQNKIHWIIGWFWLNHVYTCIYIHISLIDSINWYMNRKSKYACNLCWYFVSENLDFSMEKSWKSHGTFSKILVGTLNPWHCTNIHQKNCRTFSRNMMWPSRYQMLWMEIIRVKQKGKNCNWKETHIIDQAKGTNTKCSLKKLILWTRQ